MKYPIYVGDKSFKDRKEAYRYAEKIQGKVNKGKAGRPGKITLGEFIDEHNKVMAGQVAYRTLIEQMRALKMFSEHVGPNNYLNNITPRHAESFVSKRLADGLSPASVNKDIRTLKSIFNLAIEPRGYMEEGTNLFAKIKQRKTSSSSPRYISVDEFARVYAAANSLWWKTFLALAYTSGGRKDELLNLTWSDVDFENQNIRLVPKKASEQLLAWEPKDHEGRVIPIPSEVIQLLANLQAEAEEDSSYVFISAARLKHILSRITDETWAQNCGLVNNLLKRLKALCRRSNVKEFSLHDLRRSCITNWAEKLPIQAVQELAGHSKMETTRKYYLSVRKSDMDSARKLQSKVMTKLTNFLTNSAIFEGFLDENKKGQQT